MANEVVWISRGQGLAGFFSKILVEKIVRWLRKKRYFCGAKGDNGSLVGRCDLVRNRNFLGLPFFLVTFWASERELGIIAEL